jgi:putative iron-only hydrogenase system regulator
MEKRVGFVGIIIHNRKQNASHVNAVLSDFGDNIIVRTGVPQVNGDTSIIMLAVSATSDHIGALTGRLGALTGVSVKSMLAKQGE